MKLLEIVSRMIKLESITKSYGGITAVKDLTLEVKKGECVVLLGPSGCGKTTTLKMINRLIAPTSGRIYVEGQDISTVNPIELRRQIGYVIQRIGLLPHMTISDNIALVPRLKGWPSRTRKKRADELLVMVGLDPETYRDKYPHQLSGGERQRVGVARALAVDPPILLMDEPFGALDPITRVQLQDEFLKLEEQVKKTVVFVTHDMDEAVRLADRIAIMDDGQLHQYATPMEMLRHPADEFVTQFMGGDRFFRQLKLLTVRDVMVRNVPGAQERPEAIPQALEKLEQRGTGDSPHSISSECRLDIALKKMLTAGKDQLSVEDERGTPIGILNTECFHAVLSNSSQREEE
jgi:osmoprotectant transport system ATP-binding protein